MDLHLDAQSEQRIQREIDLGHYREPSEVIAHALTLLEAQEDWLQRNKEAINERLEESFAQAERGELHTPEEARALLTQDREERAKLLIR